MKAIKKQFKSIALTLCMLILLQSCSVYKSANVTLEEAVIAKAKVRVIKKNGEKVKYFRLTFEDGQYKSIEKIGGGSIKTELAVNDIEKVQLKDKVLSTVLSILPVVVIYGGLFLIFPDGIGLGY